MNIDITPIEKKIKKLKQKDPSLFNVLKKKIMQISALDEEQMGHFKNLRKPLNDYKRVYIKKNFVLIFRVYEDTIIFEDFDHHDMIYDRQ